MATTTIDQPNDIISDVMRAMGKRGAQKRWAAAGDDDRKAHGAMLAKARKRAKALKTKVDKKSSKKS